LIEDRRGYITQKTTYATLIKDLGVKSGMVACWVKIACSTEKEIENISPF
jgi:hypothetical protein